MLILYAIQVYMGRQYDPSKYQVTIWIDNAEVLARGEGKEYGNTIKSRMVLDYDMWTVMTMLQDKIQFKLKWEKVDSHIETRQYKDGATPKGDKYSIRLNKSVDAWAGEAREWGEALLQGDESQQYFYSESQVIVQLPDLNYIYGNIASAVREVLTKDKMIKYLLARNPHWTQQIFDTIDWESMELCLGKMKDTKVTNVLKMAHGWQHDGYQKGLFFGAGEHCECPAGCRIPEDRFRHMSCPALPQ